MIDLKEFHVEIFICSSLNLLKNHGIVRRNRHSAKFLYLGGMCDSILLRDSLNLLMKPGLTKLLNIKMQPIIWVYMISWNMEGHESSLTTTYLYLTLGMIQIYNVIIVKQT